MEGALKESMWQLRQMREVQEQTIHDAVVKKTREWQNVRLELEQRLADADQQLVESGFQNSLLSKRVEEQAETVAQLNQACSRAEGRVDTLQVRVETFERENASLKYEVTVLNKELIIRNQEREMNKKSLDVASRQKAESSKKLHKLEIECQRLRALVRKKLPGPGALVQMKLEVEGLDTERRDSSNRWRSDSKPLNSPKAAGSIVSSEGDFSDRLLTMEEETKMLKEVLSERNNELQTARIMCARMAEKLSVFERQVGKTLNSPQKSLLSQSLHGVDSFVSLSSLNELSHASLSEDGIEDDRSVADSLASTLATELAHFRKEGMATFQEPRTSQKVSAPLDSMEDFIEVERLVSLSSEHSTVTEGKMTEAMAASKEALSMKEAELQLAVGQCAELNKKLALTEQQLCLLSSKNAANELNLYSLQQKLNMILEKLEDGNEVRAIEGIKSALSDSQCSSVDGLQAHVTKLSKVSSNVSSEARESPTEKSLGIKLSGVESDLRGAIEEMIHILEVLASETRTHHDSTTCCEDFIPAHSVMSQNLFDSSSTITNLKSSANQFMQGEMELIQLIKSLSSVLVHIRVPGRSVPVPQINKERQNHDQQEVLSDAGSPISNTSNCEIYEQPGVKASNVGKKMTSVKESQLDCELRMLRAEKAALESHMKAEFSRMDKVEEMLLQLQREKSELLQALEVEKEKLESAKSQMLDAEHLIATLRVRLASAEMSRNTADERLTYANAENSKLTLQLQEQQSELMNMRESLKTLEECLEEERTRNGELQFRLDEVQSSLERYTLIL
ncbi:hypothetical protein KP509_31G017100 [Ceratopteris richardii]|uniref:Uncharacterized protein n=1 Tax=Ceratopteris richardii TaxID=49495 RepID=A0A8T2QXL5_CERRI|nr:hypothetical protein KP509_31G017100 [Ceratopteris richardii]